VTSLWSSGIPQETEYLPRATTLQMKIRQPAQRAETPTDCTQASEGNVNVSDLEIV
jgi:hypothetical protein